MRPGYVADRVDHRQDNESKRQRDPNVCDCAAGHVVDHDRARARENERKRSEKFSGELVHRLIHPREKAGLFGREKVVESFRGNPDVGSDVHQVV